MASAFDGLGMGYLGSERSRFKGSEGPSLGAGLLGIGLQQAGIIDNLNDMGNPQDFLKKKILGAFAPDQGRAINDGTKGYQPSQNLWEAPAETNAMVQPPMPVAPGIAPSAAPDRTIDQHVDDVFPRQTSFVSPNTLTPKDSSQDQTILAMASQPAPPPNGPVGQQQGGGGGGLMKAIAPEIFKLLLA